MNSTLDWLRPYTVPRALLVSLLFVIGVAFRITALLDARHPAVPGRPGAASRDPPSVPSSARRGGMRSALGGRAG